MSTRRNHLSLRPIYVAVTCGVVAFMSGCALQTVESTLPVSNASGLHGIAKGGQQPVTGSTISLVATGSTGYGSATTVLSTTTSDATGSFSLPAYTCPSPTTPTFLIAKTGNPGLAAGANNTAIYMVDVTGPCGNLSPSNFFVINEVTTVAAAFTMRPFSTGLRAGTSATNAIGMTNAMLTAQILVGSASGKAGGANLPAGLTVPVATINALANSLAACVNSSDPTATPCANLFSYTNTPTVGSNANVYYAALAIANNPTTNVGSIYNLAGAAPPFQPTLAGQPSDWSLSILHTAGNLSQTHTAIDIDVNGNVWLATTGGSAGTVEEISNHGAPLKTGFLDGVIDGSLGLAIEPLGNLVVTSSTLGNSSVIRFTPGGSILYTNTAASLVTPAGVAIDANNNAIVADPGANKLFTIPIAGIITTAAADTNGPVYPAIDATGNIFTTETKSISGTRFAGGLAGAKTTFTHFGSNGGHLSFDSAGTVYEAYANFVDLFTNAGAYTTYYQTYGGQGKSMRVDGLGNIWTGNVYGASRLQETAATLSVSTVIVQTLPSSPVSDIAIDKSGNVWLANAKPGGLVEVVGAAAPLTTPISVAASTNMLGQRP